jgi:hypothetical protein
MGTGGIRAVLQQDTGNRQHSEERQPAPDMPAERVFSNAGAQQQEEDDVDQVQRAHGLQAGIVFQARRKRQHDAGQRAQQAEGHQSSSQRPQRRPGAAEIGG